MAITTNYTTDQAAHPATHRISRQQRILAIVFVFSFVLDFKGVAGGSPIQFIMVGLNIAVFLLLAASYRMVLPGRGLGAFVFWGWMAFLVTGTMGAFVNGTPIGHYLRIAYTFMLFLEGFLVAWWTTKDPRDAGTIVAAMMTTAIISLFFTFGWGFYFTGQNSEEIRYQILSPLIPLLLTVAGYDLFFARRRRLWSFILLAIALGMIALSATRGEILIIGFVAGFVLLAALMNAKRFANFPRPIIRAAVWGGIIVVVGLPAAIFFNPDVLGRWVHRSFGVAKDVTFWTRAAAVLGQYQALVASPFGWLTGKGFGSAYPWPVSDFPWILEYLGEKAVNRSAWFPGEFMWMTFLFYGGFIIGPLAALVLLSGAVRAFHLLRVLLRTQSWRIPQARPVWVGVLGYFAFLGMGFTSNPFILRLAALFMGLCLGLIVAQSGLPSLSINRRRC
jgi:hypothetical protein